MFNFNSAARSALFELGVLALDKDGEQVLAGLTAAETLFLMTCDLTGDAVGSGEAQLYDQLRNRFHAAREETFRNSAALTSIYLGQHRSRSPGNG